LFSKYRYYPVRNVYPLHQPYDEFLTRQGFIALPFLISIVAGTAMVGETLVPGADHGTIMFDDREGR